MNILLGVGNELLSDDGAGVHLVHRAEIPEWTLIEGGIVPENFTGIIREYKPEILLIIDAADMNLPAGSIRIIPKNRIEDTGTGTHQLSLERFIEHITPYCREIILIGIQPASLDLDDTLSHEVEKAVQELLFLLHSHKWRKIPEL